MMNYRVFSVITTLLLMMAFYSKATPVPSRSESITVHSYHAMSDPIFMIAFLSGHFVTLSVDGKVHIRYPINYKSLNWSTHHSSSDLDMWLKDYKLIPYAAKEGSELWQFSGLAEKGWLLIVASEDRIKFCDLSESENGALALSIILEIPALLPSGQYEITSIDFNPQKSLLLANIANIATGSHHFKTWEIQKTSYSLNRLDDWVLTTNQTVSDTIQAVDYEGSGSGLEAISSANGGEWQAAAGELVDSSRRLVFVSGAEAIEQLDRGVRVYHQSGNTLVANEQVIPLNGQIKGLIMPLSKKYVAFDLLHSTGKRDISVRKLSDSGLPEASLESSDLYTHSNSHNLRFHKLQPGCRPSILQTETVLGKTIHAFQLIPECQSDRQTQDHAPEHLGSVAEDRNIEKAAFYDKGNKAALLFRRDKETYDLVFWDLKNSPDAFSGSRQISRRDPVIDMVIEPEQGRFLALLDRNRPNDWSRVTIYNLADSPLNPYLEQDLNVSKELLKKRLQTIMAEPRLTPYSEDVLTQKNYIKAAFIKAVQEREHRDNSILRRYQSLNDFHLSPYFNNTNYRLLTALLTNGKRPY